MTSVSLGYLFRTFLKIGFTSFGGYTSLIALVRDKMVTRDKVIGEDLVVDSLAIASVLPGPLAVNCVANIGFSLRGWKGFWISIISVLFPSLLLMVLFAEFYDQLQGSKIMQSIMVGVIPIVVAIIASVAFKMFQNQVNHPFQKLIFLCTIFLALIFKSYLTIFICMIAGGLIGYFFNQTEGINPFFKHLKIEGLKALLRGLIITLLTFVVLFFCLEERLSDLFSVFTGVSLTLFGGGYVMIPVLHDIVVVRQSWLSENVFVDAIAFGQVTPGPILVSAAFIGYKIAGLQGAILSTIGIFIPSALLMISMGTLFEKIKDNSSVKSVLSGIRPVVVAFILYSVVVLLHSIGFNGFALLFVLIGFLLLIMTKLNAMFLICLGGLMGLIFL